MSSSKTIEFERKKLPDGTDNPKYVDLCDEDPAIAGQKFVCLSFVSPENILKRRELYLFEEFVKNWDFTKSMSKMNDFIAFVSYKYNVKMEDIVADFQDYSRAEEAKLRADGSQLNDDFKNFIDKNEDALNAKFNKENKFQTSVRGLKVRGVYPTQEEAELKCKSLRSNDPTHDIFVGPVGVWVPWDPDAYKTGKVEFMEEELNRLHKEKIANELRAKEEFENRVKETKRKAIEENIKLAEKSGNKLTQNINENGDLVGVKDTVDFDSRELSDVAAAKLAEKIKSEEAAAAAGEKSET